MRKSKEFQKLVVKMREKGFYTPQVQRSVDWSAYILNQINDLVDTLKFVRTNVDKVHQPRESNSVGRPPTDVGDLAKAILFVEMVGIPESLARIIHNNRRKTNYHQLQTNQHNHELIRKALFLW